VIHVNRPRPAVVPYDVSVSVVIATGGIHLRCRLTDRSSAHDTSSRLKLSNI
jgi:hypothetical protein